MHLSISRSPDESLRGLTGVFWAVIVILWPRTINCRLPIEDLESVRDPLFHFSGHTNKWSSFSVSNGASRAEAVRVQVTAFTSRFEKQTKENFACRVLDLFLLIFLGRFTPAISTNTNELRRRHTLRRVNCSSLHFSLPTCGCSTSFCCPDSACYTNSRFGSDPNR